jgi:hypothetical protein
MADRSAPTNFPTRLLLGFVAGFLATLTFHQLMLGLLWGAGVAPFRPFLMAATRPFGVPTIFSLAFWGGIWGILFAMVSASLPRGGRYWATAFLLGGIFPSLVSLLVVLPLKGKPMGGGWQPHLWLTAFMVNGAWGIGTTVYLKVFRAWFIGRKTA